MLMLFARTPSITAAEAAEGLAQRQLVLVDVRQPAELRRGRIHRSLNIPLAELGDRLSELDRNRQVAFLCHSGTRSSRATRIAIKAGYAAVNVCGGLIAWNHAGLPINR
jgi:rhodanese-related sulfurtransferase